jgi:AraC family transcriptional regulator
MSPKEPLVVDLAQLEKMSHRITGSSNPARQFAQWDSISLAHCHHSPCEFQEHQWMQHLIGISGAGSPATVEHRLGGTLHQLGFAIPSAFSRLFRQLTGTTPKAFRQQR